MGYTMIFPKKPASGRPFFSGPAMRAGVIGLHLVSGLLSGGVIGYLLDSWRGTKFWLWIFLLLGFVAGCINIYRDVRKLLRENDEEDAARRNAKR